MYRDSELYQYLMLQNITGGANFAHVVLLVIIFLILAYRRELIESFRLFRFGVILYVIAIVVPSVLQPLFVSVYAGHAGLQGFYLSMLNVVPALAWGLSVLCLSFAMIPRRALAFPKKVVEQKKHPLDD